MLIGLKKLSEDLNNQLKLYHKAVCDIIGESVNDYGHASDFVYSDDVDVDTLIWKHVIKVKKGSPDHIVVPDENGENPFTEITLPKRDLQFHTGV